MEALGNLRWGYDGVLMCANTGVPGSLRCQQDVKKSSRS